MFFGNFISSSSMSAPILTATDLYRFEFWYNSVCLLSLRLHIVSCLSIVWVLAKYFIPRIFRLYSRECRFDSTSKLSIVVVWKAPRHSLSA